MKPLNKIKYLEIKNELNKNSIKPISDISNDEEFLYLAHKLGTDTQFRTNMKQLVLEKVDLLFENDDVIDEWVNVLKGLMLTAK